MDLAYDNAIYEDVKAGSSINEGFNIHGNSCYGEVAAIANKNVHECYEEVASTENKSADECYEDVASTANKNVHNFIMCKNYSYKIIMVYVIVFALLLGTAGVCVAFAVQITTLKSEIASLQMASSSQNSFTDTLEHQLNTSIDMLYQQLSQQNTSIDSAYQQLNEQLNTSIDMLYQQLSQQNASINCS